MKRLAIVSTHPIQYNAPFFKLLAERGQIQIKVFYTLSQWAKKVQDSGFGQEISWDLPLLEGYEHQFVDNVAQLPSSKHFKGIDCPSIIVDILAYKPDAVLVFGWNLKAHWKVMRYFKHKIPVYFRGDSTLLDEKAGVKQWLRRMALTFVYKHVDYAFYVGTENKKYYVKHGLKENQLVFAPHAVDNDRFGAESLRADIASYAIADDYGIDNERLGFVFAGKFEPKKNPLLLLQLALEDEFKAVNFIFVGSGVLENQMKELAVEHQNIYFLPFHNQTLMPAIYRLGQYFVLPSQGPGETWGLGVNEAMACGVVPIVSDKVGCASDLVVNDETGFVFKSGSLTELRDIVKKILKNIDSWETWRKNALLKVATFNYTETAKSIEQTVLASKQNGIR